ncbi:hypothetical protein [Halomicronema hongdechloris]|uniref:hypothetical protein n=1 Tax=Halomicronema hongdechloris TaxID=1209493 RepID=UPI00211AC5E7|nr:hypothetical protein [Halomicronema hongdechloris]
MPSMPFDTVNHASAVPTAVRQSDDASQSLTYDLVIVGAASSASPWLQPWGNRGCGWR